VIRLLVTANVVPSSPILVTLIMEAIRSSETSVPTRITRGNITEDEILHVFRTFRDEMLKIMCGYKLQATQRNRIENHNFGEGGGGMTE
jgi:hypothetical protein